jgi:hypothetical protein
MHEKTFNTRKETAQVLEDNPIKRTQENKYGGVDFSQSAPGTASVNDPLKKLQ